MLCLMNPGYANYSVGLFTAVGSPRRLLAEARSTGHPVSAFASSHSKIERCRLPQALLVTLSTAAAVNWETANKSIPAVRFWEPVSTREPASGISTTTYSAASALRDTLTLTAGQGSTYRQLWTVAALPPSSTKL